MFESDANSFHKCKITFELTYMPRLSLLPFKAHAEYLKVRCCCLVMGSELKNESFSTHKWVTTGWLIYAQQTIMISCVMGKMRVEDIRHVKPPSLTQWLTKRWAKDIKKHKKKSAKNEKMRRWNVGRREKWNCHLSIIISIILCCGGDREWDLHVNEFQHDIIKSWKKMKNSSWRSLNLFQNCAVATDKRKKKQRVSVWPQSTLYSILEWLS